MRKSAIFLAMSVLIPCIASGSEFSDTDIFPVAIKMDFSKDGVFLQSQASANQLPELYRVDRATHGLESITATDEAMSSGLVTYPAAIEYHQMLTHLGKDYASPIPYCGKNEEGSDDDETDESRDAPAPSTSPGCEARYFFTDAVEESGDVLLMAAYLNEDDYAGPSSPVVVIDIHTRAVIKDFPFGATIIRVDPLTQDIWMAGPSGLLILDRKLEVKKQLYFYVGFSGDMHAPKLMLADKPTQTDPYAEIGRELAVKDPRAWYAAVQSLPADARGYVTLYGYHMSGFRPPQGLGPLLPFFYDAVLHPAGVDPRNRWLAMYNLCTFKDPSVRPFMEKFAAGKSDEYRDYTSESEYHMVDAAYRCLRYLDTGTER